MLFVAAQSFRRGRPAATAGATAPRGEIIERTPIRRVNSVLTLGSIALSVAALISFGSSISGRLGVFGTPSASNNSTSSSVQLRGGDDQALVDDKRENDIQTFDFAPDGDITEQPPHLTPIDPIISLQSRGFTTLDKAHREGLIHAGNFVYVVDKNDKLLLMRRGPDLVTCPLAWSMVGEHAYRDETKKETLMRGIEEELGGKTLKSLVDAGSYAELSELPLFYFRDYGPELDGRIDRQVTYIWLVELSMSAEELENGILQLDEEVYEHKWMTLDEAEKWVKDDMAAVREGGKSALIGYEQCGGKNSKYHGTANRGGGTSSKRYLDGKSSVSTLESGGGASFDLRPQDLPQRNLDLSDFVTDDEFSVEYAHSGLDEHLGRKGVITHPGPSRRRVNKIGRQIRSIITAPSPQAAMEQVQQDNTQDVQYKQVGGHDSADSDGLVGVHVFSDEHDEKDEDNEDRRHDQHGHYQENEEQDSDRLPGGGETARSPKSRKRTGGGYCASFISCLLYTLCWVMVRLFMLLAAIGMVYGMYRLILDLRKGEIQIAIPSISPENKSGGTGDAIGEIGSSQIAFSQPPTPSPIIAPTLAIVEMTISPPTTPSPFVAPTKANAEEIQFEQEEKEEIEEAEEELLEEEEPNDHVEKVVPAHNEQSNQETSSSNTMVISLSAQNPSDIATPRFRLMHNAIIQKGVSDGDDLKPRLPITPQLRALDWVANVDPQESDIIEDNPVENSFPSYFYRYALATLWFSAHAGADGKEDGLKEFEFIPWSDERGWMEGTGVCFWSGVECTNTDDIPTEIDLSNFELDGTIPRELFTVFSGPMTSLRLARNKLQGTIPDEIGHMKSLSTLDLHHNKDLGGPVPPSLFYSVPTLKIVRLGECSFSGDIPKMNSPDLEVFDVSWQGLTGTLPPGISNSKKLRVLTVSGNSFVGNLPDISDMNDLVFLELNDNKFSGSLYEDLQQFKELKAILLEKNELTGTISERLLEHDKLEELVIGYNNLGGSIPTSFNLPKLRLLRLSNNAFEGSLPWEKMVTYENLEQIDLAENRFSGTISGDFSRLVNLRLLSIFHNDGMRGAMPESVCTLVNSEQSLKVLTKACGGELSLVDCSCCNECWDG